jgi:upstream activation factor subunit UAF30
MKAKSFQSASGFASDKQLAKEVGLTLKDEKVVSGVLNKRKPNAAFMKPQKLSPELAEFVGVDALPRTAVTKKLWTYIKKNGLQDSKNVRMINADDKLKDIFGGKSQVSMFEMAQLVSKHLK